MFTPSYKVCLLGAPGVGKTCLVRRFAYNVMDPRCPPSVGLTVSSKTVVVAHAGAPTALTLLLWDPASPRHMALPPAGYLDGAAGILLVADGSRPATLDVLETYAGLARQHCPVASIAVALNKHDSAWADTVAARARSLAMRLHAPLFVTSALLDHNVEHAFRTLAALAHAKLPMGHGQ